MVLRLRKALYGLRQAPRAWNAKLDATLGKLGFQRYATKHEFYTRRRGKEELVVGVYVDDLIVTGARAEDIDSFKREVAARFRMSDLGAHSYYLGIEVRPGEELKLGQSAYATKLLERSGMAECKPCVTPMEERLKLTKASTTTKGGRNTLPEHRRWSVLPSAHKARHCVRRGLHQSLHGGS